MNVLNEVKKSYKYLIGRTLFVKGKNLNVIGIDRHPKEKEFLVLSFNDNSYLKLSNFNKEMLV